MPQAASVTEITSGYVHATLAGAFARPDLAGKGPEAEGAALATRHALIGKTHFFNKLRDLLCSVRTSH